MHTPLEWIRQQWPCISTVGFIGFLAGALFTRRFMAPSFCPSCLQQKQWLKELKKTPEEKAAESRLFYRRRQKDKEEPK
jgi:hypothetical protein